MMVINTQISVLTYRCIKLGNWCEQHKPPLQRLSNKATWAGGRLKGFQNFPSSKSRYQTVIMASCTPLLLILSLDQLGNHNVKKWHKHEPRSSPPSAFAGLGPCESANSSHATSRVKYLNQYKQGH